METLKFTDIYCGTYRIEKLLFSLLNITNEFYYASLENSPKLVTLLGDGRPFFLNFSLEFLSKIFCLYFLFRIDETTEGIFSC